MKPREVLALCREKEVKAIDLRFADFLGAWRHVTIPVGKLDEDLFEDGLGFDGSSVCGWQAIHESDMLLVPVPETAVVDPLPALPTLALICSIQDPVTREDYSRDPRHVARKAANYLRSTGIADTCQVGPEVEFFVFDEVRFDDDSRGASYALDPNTGPRRREGSFPCPPADRFADLRSEMMQAMIQCGIDVEAQHHESAGGGQCEIGLRHQELVRMADQVCFAKYVVRNVARRHAKTATFMPKPLHGDNGSGMHTHLSLWRDGQPLFAGTGYAGLSDTALHAIGGILRHAPALLALTNPATNSYTRLVPGHDAPVALAYSQRNRSAACRIPVVSANPRAKRIEFRCPDALANPYLAFAAILMAAIDGIQNKLHPGEPLEAEGDDPAPKRRAGSAPVPRSLEEALERLERDHEFLLRGDVFTPDVIATWLAAKREHELAPLRLRPHPYEFCLYYDA